MKSPTLETIVMRHEQRDLMGVLKDANRIRYDRGIYAVGPTHEFPLPWITERIPGTGACSILSVGGNHGVRTVVKMLDCDTAEQIIDEVTDV